MTHRQETVNPIIHCTAARDGERAVELLAATSGLSKGRIKDAMSKGAVWLRRGRSERRLRRAQTAMKAGDRLSLYYDAEVLRREPLAAEQLIDSHAWSAWSKPAGTLSQGSRWGDHCALSRQVEKCLGREVRIVHRLDREASGLMLFAHDAASAGALSRQFAERSVAKRYRVGVLGRPAIERINLELDGKPAVSDICVRSSAGGRSLLDVRIETGRKHQIRRHLAAIGHPVIGDPRYGRDNSSALGLHLTAVEIGFKDPCSGRPVAVRLPERLWPDWLKEWQR